MLIGVPKEIKNQEYRIGLVPASVHELVSHGHKVLVEHNAAIGIGFVDSDYEKVGAIIAFNAADIFAKAEMVVKVKELQASERALLREGQLLFTYLHLAADPDQTADLIKSGCIAIAYETVTDKDGRLPLLAPMSAVAGRLSIQMGAHCLEKRQGGSGVLLAGVPGVAPGKILILGGGVVGSNALLMAVGMGAEVVVMDRSPQRLQELDMQFGSRIKTVYSSQANIEKYAQDADLIIGAVLLPGAAAPKLITRDILRSMRSGSVVVDVAIDQGGCFETSHPTTHDDPTFVEEDIVHYCVANMPGAVPRTSTFALNNATLPFVLALADKGYVKALQEDLHLRAGLNIYKGKVTAVLPGIQAAFVDIGLG